MKNFALLFLFATVFGCGTKVPEDHVLTLEIYKGNLAGESFEYQATIWEMYYTQRDPTRIIRLISSDHPKAYFEGYDQDLDDSVDVILVFRKLERGWEHQYLDLDPLVQVDFFESAPTNDTDPDFTLRELSEVYDLMCQASREFREEENLVIRAHWDEFSDRLVIKE